VELAENRIIALSAEEVKKVLVIFTLDTAKRCLPNFESAYIDSRPSDAIGAAERCLKEPTAENMNAAREAAKAAHEVARFSLPWESDLLKRTPLWPVRFKGLMEASAGAAAGAAESAAALAGSPAEWRTSKWHAVYASNHAIMSAEDAKALKEGKNYMGAAAIYEKDVDVVNLRGEMEKLTQIRMLETLVNDEMGKHKSNAADKELMRNSSEFATALRV
jgi:hypothetical protein